MNSKIKKIIVIGIILVIVLIIGFIVLNHIRKSYDVEEVIERLKQAIEETGFSSINNALKYPNKTAGGYHWAYLENQKEVI